MDRGLEIELRGGGEGDFVGELVAAAGRKPGHAREGDLLFGQLGFERDDALLLRKLLDLAAVNVDLRREAHLPLLLCLAEESGGGVQLRVRGLDPLRGCEHLQVCAADGKDDRVACIPCGEFCGVVKIFGRAIVVDGSEIDD